MESVRGWQWGCRLRYRPAKAGLMMGRTLFRLERSGQNVIWAAGLWSGSIRVQAQPSAPRPACIGGADRVPLVPHRQTFLLFKRRCSGFIGVSVAHWGRRPHGASSGRVGDRPCGCREVGSSLTGADFRPVAWGCWNERLSSRARRSQRLPGRMVETPGFGGCSETVNLAGSGLFVS